MNRPESTRFVDLMEADEKEAQALTRSVNANKDRLHVLVHPFYSRKEGGLFCPAYKSQPEFDNRRDTFIASCLKKKLPLVILEEPIRLDDIADRITGSGTVYTIATRQDSPDPRYPHNWEAISTRLRQVGVRTAMVSGQTLRWDDLSSGLTYDVSLPDDEGVPASSAKGTVTEFLNIAAEKQGKAREILEANSLTKNGAMPQGCVGVAALGLLKAGIDVKLTSLVA